METSSNTDKAAGGAAIQGLNRHWGKNTEESLQFALGVGQPCGHCHLGEEPHLREERGDGDPLALVDVVQTGAQVLHDGWEAGAGMLRHGSGRGGHQRKKQT